MSINEIIRHFQEDCTATVNKFIYARRELEACPKADCAIKLVDARVTAELLDMFKAAFTSAMAEIPDDTDTGGTTNFLPC